MSEKVNKYLETNIKDIITDFPSVQNALDKFEIGCAPCSLGTCKLKDVIGIHDLNAENEKILLKEIFGIIYPGEELVIPRVGADKPAGGNAPSLSPIMKELMAEHKFILKVISLVPAVVEKIDVQIHSDKVFILELVDFIRHYADKFHHAKEEDILFKYFDENLDILKVMLADHTTGRGYVAQIVNGTETGDNTLVKENLTNYAQLLSEHIQKEDTILYPWMDKNLSTKQIGEMFSKFMNVNSSQADVKAKYEEFVTNLGNRF